MPKNKTQLPVIQIGSRRIGIGYPSYFIADIAANHDGSLSRARRLIRLAKEAGADAAKFQHFRADKIVSGYGFEHLDGAQSHQSKWRRPVVEVYRKASVPWEWTAALRDACRRVGIDFFSAPYDLEAIDMLDAFVPAYKVGSGDINWSEALVRMAKKNKPVFLATGASAMPEVVKAVRTLLRYNRRLCLMQCNTNYTGDVRNLGYAQLDVLKTYTRTFPGMVLGLSDHTPGDLTVL
ncbi:MAG: N-acetylneuraminate synthase family protein, partial [Candidatus Omnitrophota bacterium]